MMPAPGEVQRVAIYDDVLFKGQPVGADKGFDNFSSVVRGRDT